MKKVVKLVFEVKQTLQFVMKIANFKYTTLTGKLCVVAVDQFNMFISNLNQALLHTLYPVNSV